MRTPVAKNSQISPGPAGSRVNFDAHLGTPIAPYRARTSRSLEKNVEHTSKIVINRALWLLAGCQVCWAILAVGQVLATV